ncbi:MAG: hypothetical protein ACRDRJ_00735 [Streptosporangiaceae bacterium]
MRGYYAVRAQGNSWAWAHTPGATPADFDQAVAEAKSRSQAAHDYVVLYHDGRGGSRLIVTLADGQLAWPRLSDQPHPRGG